MSPPEEVPHPPVGHSPNLAYNRNYRIQQNRLSYWMESWKQLYTLLKHDSEMLAFVDLIDQAEPIFSSLTPEQFAQHQTHQRLVEQLARLNPTSFEKLVQAIGPLPRISAKIIKSTKSYTLALLVIPSDQVFGWHNHHNMNGISRCVAGQLEIRSLDPHKMVPVEVPQGTYAYPLQQIRKQALFPNENPISIIYPHTYNIHEIRAVHMQSAFIDLLIPEYPEEDCTYFRTVGEEGELTVEVVKECGQPVVGMDDYVKKLRTGV